MWNHAPHSAKKYSTWNRPALLLQLVYTVDRLVLAYDVVVSEIYCFKLKNTIEIHRVGI